MTEPENLTRREREIKQLILGGHSRKVIAEQLSISPRTVQRHCEAIYRKLGIHSLGELWRHHTAAGARA